MLGIRGIALFLGLLYLHLLIQSGAGKDLTFLHIQCLNCINSNGFFHSNTPSNTEDCQHIQYIPLCSASHPFSSFPTKTASSCLYIVHPCKSRREKEVSMQWWFQEGLREPCPPTFFLQPSVLPCHPKHSKIHATTVEMLLHRDSTSWIDVIHYFIDLQLKFQTQ